MREIIAFSYGGGRKRSQVHHVHPGAGNPAAMMELAARWVTSSKATSVPFHLGDSGRPARRSNVLSDTDELELRIV